MEMGNDGEQSAFAALVVQKTRRLELQRTSIVLGFMRAALLGQQKCTASFMAFFVIVARMIPQWAYLKPFFDDSGFAS